jgi:hypothetical protein
MTDQIILTVPEEIAERARQIAETTAQSAEAVLIDHLQSLSSPLPTLPPDEQAELAALHNLSDDALWTMTRAQMPDDVQARAQQLMDRNTSGQMTDEERTELAGLAQRADRLMLRKAEAAAILRQRGHHLTQADFKPAHD